MNNRIIIVGKSGSGKNVLKNKFIGRGFSAISSYTTRPKRNGEIDNIDYNFISKDRFEELIESDYFYEYTSFNGWYYGTSKEDFYKNGTVFIMNPHGISKISKRDRLNSFVIYLDIDYEIRLKRLKNRNSKHDSIERRMKMDELDFEQFYDYDLIIKNDKF